jgi:pyruvate formate lyase activating enzyme
MRLGYRELTWGTIFNIQRFAVNDGPGIRTTVFFKGCPLRCFWCHNPESLDPTPQLAYYRSKCTGCRQCVATCPRGALGWTAQGLVIDRIACQRCGTCAQACPARSLVILGRRVSVSEVLDEVLADRPFYESSGGGVTLSGGEPLLQGEFALALAAACAEVGLEVALDTSGYGPWETLAALAPYCRHVLYDIKTLDPQRHRRGTGADNSLILSNLRRLVALPSPPHITLRYPLIPGFNDRPEDFAALACLAHQLALPVDVLPYHGLAAEKYEALSLPRAQLDARRAASRAQELCAALTAQGLLCRLA